MADRNPARLAAPLALAAAVVAVVVVIAASGSGSSPGTSSAAAPPVHARHAHHHRAAPRFYVVKAGDTLSVISSRTGVSLERIQALNPQVDPQALQTGQRLKLSP